MLLFGLKFREKIVALSAEGLNEFLLKSMPKNATQGISGTLFVTFRTLNCVMETSGFPLHFFALLLFYPWTFVIFL